MRKSNIKRVLFIARVSSEKQGQGEANIPEQVRACEKFVASQEGWELVKVIDDTKVSGYKTEVSDRPDLQIAREMAVNKEIDILLVFHTNRIGRRMELAPFIMGLAQHGVELWSTSEGRQTTGEEESEHMEAFQMFVKFWQSESESANKSKAVKNTLDYLKEQGNHFHGTVPFGYNLVTTDERKRSSRGDFKRIWVVDQEGEAPNVKEIFRLYVEEGLGTVKIAQYLNDNHVQKKRSTVWRANGVLRILTNPVYIGRIKYNTVKTDKKSYKVEHLGREDWKLQPLNEALRIVADDVFYKAQELTQVKKNIKKNIEGRVETGQSVKSEVLLSGLVFCEKCGCRLTTGYSDKKYVKADGTHAVSRYRRYTCQEGRNFRGVHGRTNWGSSKVDKLVQEAILEVIEGLKFEDVMETIASHKNDDMKKKEKRIKEVEAELEKLNKGLKRANEEMEKHFLGESNFTSEQLSNMLNKFGKDVAIKENEKAQLKKSLDSAIITQTDLESLKNDFTGWKDIYIQAPLNQKKQMLSRIVDKVVLTPEGTARVQFKLVIESALNSLENFHDSTDPKRQLMDSSNKEEKLAELLLLWASNPSPALMFEWDVKIA